MKKDKNLLKIYLKGDAIALGINNFKLINRLKWIFTFNYIPVYQYYLRCTEYYANNKSSIIGKFLYIYYMYRWKKLGIKCGFTIPLDVFGPGLCIVHIGNIIVNHNAKVGSNCRIHPGVNIGASGGVGDAPQIGNNVYFAPGVKIYGRVSVADNVAFAANAAVHKDCLVENSLYGGVPAKRISDFNVSKVIKHLQDKQH